MRKIKFRLSFIFAIVLMLTITVSGFVMPSSESFADDQPALILDIGQSVETEGEAVHKDYTFNYALTSLHESFPMPEEADGMSWNFELTNDESKQLQFLIGDEEAAPNATSIRFNAQGLYQYELGQRIHDRMKGVTYDESAYDIYVKVVDKLGLKIEAVWVQRETGEKPDSIQFVNKVRKSKVIGDPPVKVVKRIYGDIPTKEDKFVFVMKPEQEDFPLPYGAKGQYEVTLYGEGEIEIGNIEFDAPGVYEYRVFEKGGPSLDYTYDKTVFNVIYTIDELEDGTMTCEREIIREDTYTKKCVFENIYSAPKTTPQGDTRRGDGNSKRGGGYGDRVKTGDYNGLSNYLAMLVLATAMAMSVSHGRKRRSNEDRK